MNPLFDHGQKSSWMTPADARRAEFASVTQDMFQYLESLRQRLYEDDDTSCQLGPDINGFHGSAPTASPPFPNTFHSSHAVSQIDDRTFGSRQKAVDQYSLAPTSPVVLPNQHATGQSFSSPHITNQKRTDSVNRGGSNRREARADKVCMFCSASFTRNERLRYHMESVHLQLEPEFACDVPGCNRAFRQKSDLLRHQRTVHRELNPN